MFFTVFLAPFYTVALRSFTRGEKRKKQLFLKPFLKYIFVMIFFALKIWDRVELFELVENRTFFPDVDDVGKSYGGGTPWYPPWMIEFVMGTYIYMYILRPCDGTGALTSATTKPPPK